MRWRGTRPRPTRTPRNPDRTIRGRAARIALTLDEAGGVQDPAFTSSLGAVQPDLRVVLGVRPEAVGVAVVLHPRLNKDKAERALRRYDVGLIGDVLLDLLHGFEALILVDDRAL